MTDVIDVLSFFCCSVILSVVVTRVFFVGVVTIFMLVAKLSPSENNEFLCRSWSCHTSKLA